MRRSRLGALGACVLALAIVPAVDAMAAAPSATATQGLTTPTATTACNGAVQLTATVTAHGGSSGTATAVMLVLDRSGSIAGSADTAEINAAKAVIERLDAADGSANGTIDGGNTVGLEVYRNSSATLIGGFTTDVATLESELGLVGSPSGGSPHAAGISAADTALQSQTGLGHGIVLMTDGQASGSDLQAATSAADVAKGHGDLIETIAVGTSSETNLRAWATTTTDYQDGDPGPIDAGKVVTDLGAAQAGAPVQFTLSDALGSHWAASGANASTGTATPGTHSLVWSGSLADGQTATLTWTATRDGSDVYARQSEAIATATLSVTGGSGTVTPPAATTIDVLPCGGTDSATTTCTGSNCSASTTQSGVNYNVNAGSPPAGTQLALTGLSQTTPPAGACPGFKPHVKGLEIDVRPLSTDVSVTLTYTRQALGNTPWLATQVCIGTNLPFVQATSSARNPGPQAVLIPGANGLPGRWWGLLPSIPSLEYIPGAGFVTGPYVTSRSPTGPSGATLKFVMPFVGGTAGQSTDGLNGYDPKIWG
jgi:hypothetical protein